MKSKKVKRVMTCAAAAVMAVSIAACGQTMAAGDNKSAAMTTDTADEAGTESASRTAVETDKEGDGWETPATPELTDEAKTALKKATENLEGETYTPVALLGIQRAAGTSFRILCRTAPVVPDADETWSIVTVSGDPDGSCEIKETEDSGNPTNISGDEDVAGAWQQEKSPVITDDEKEVFNKAFGDADKGYEITPAAILSYQAVSGTSYCFLATKDSDGTYVFAYFSEDPDGNVSDAYTVDFRTKEASEGDTDTAKAVTIEGDNWSIETEQNQLILSLPANMTTGCNWVIDDSGNEMLTVTGEKYAEDDHPDGMAGVGGTEYFYITVNASGNGSLVFEYRQDWDGGVSDGKYNLNVTAKEENGSVVITDADFSKTDDSGTDAEDAKDEEKSDESAESGKTTKEQASPYAFDTDLFAEMTKENSGSFVFSPYSIRDCITLSYDGMSDKAKADLEKEGITASAVNAMIHFDDTVSGYDCINIANRLYLNKEKADKYNTELIRKDGKELVQMNDQTADKINRWIAEETHNRIKDLIDADSITSDTAMVPVNALWMKLSWQNEFYENEIKWQESGTEDRTYKGFSGTISNTDVIDTGDRYVIRLSYSPEFPNEVTRSDGPLCFSMYIFMDKDDDDGEKIREDVTNKNLDLQELQEMFDSYKGLSDCDEVQLYMPDFHSEYRSDVRGTLEKTGLSGIMSEEAYEKIGPMEVADIMHGAYIDTNEKGTEAAAATAEIMTGTAAMEPPVIKDLYVDHPFAYVIKEDTNDESDGQILFEGVVMRDALQEKQS